MCKEKKKREVARNEKFSQNLSYDKTFYHETKPTKIAIIKKKFPLKRVQY